MFHSKPSADRQTKIEIKKKIEETFPDIAGIAYFKIGSPFVNTGFIFYPLMAQLFNGANPAISEVFDICQADSFEHARDIFKPWFNEIGKREKLRKELFDNAFNIE